MAKLLNKAPAVYGREQERFIKELKQFHDQRGTPFKYLPTIDGNDIDLYQLYWLVTAHGGWEKVNSRGGWEEFVDIFNLGESTTNAALALKQIYLRYLDTYEKFHFLGEEEDREEDCWYNDEEDSRTRRQKAQKIQATVPLSYNYNQHNIAEHHRANYNLSTDIYRKTDYDRLTLSLISPLPNEQDFAINVCTLLSNEGKHTLKLAKCPRLLDHLLAHAGVYNNESYKEYMNTQYLESRNYDLSSFWKDVCHLPSVRELILHYDETDEEKHKRQRERDNGGGSIVNVERDNYEFDDDEDSILNLHTPKERLNALKRRAEREIAEVGKQIPDDLLFAVGRQCGTQELTGQRVLQIATIIRNLSFEEDNASVIAKNKTCLRFCLLCVGSKWSNLNQMGFDILSNIAMEIVLEESIDDSHVTEVLLSSISSGISSMDRFQVISSLDILNKLCQQSLNETYIDNVLHFSVYRQLVTYLSLHDIHLLISTLECLYSLSCLGEASCNSIVSVSGALDSLVSLITVEAQSYGPKACILMRVVETVPGTPASNAAVAAAAAAAAAVVTSQSQQLQQQQQQQAVTNSIANIPAAQVAQLSQLTPVRPQQLLQLQQQQRPVVSTQVRAIASSAPLVTTTLSQVLVQQSAPPPAVLKLPLHPVPQIIRQANPVTIVPASPQPVQVVPQQQQQIMVQRPIAPQPPQQPQQQPQQLQQLRPQQPGSQQVSLRISNDEANRQLCLSWLRATYESAPGSHIEQFVMYKQYLASMHKMGKEDVISDQHHSVCVRTLFGGSVGPNRKQMPNGTIERHFEGVRVRAVPQPLRLPALILQQQQQQQLQRQQQQQSQHVNQQQQQQQQIQQKIMPNTLTLIPPKSAATPPPQTMQVPISPQSPILTNLLHRKGVPESQQLLQKSESKTDENGTSPLDGILPKDPKFGKIQEEESNNGMLVELLEKKESSMATGTTTCTAILMNGTTTTTTLTKPVQVTDIKMNGGDDHHQQRVVGGVKRSASIEATEATPAKKIMLTNGGINGPLSDNGSGSSPMVSMSQPIIMNSSGQIIVGQPTSVKATPLPPAQQQQLIIQQQQQRLIQPAPSASSRVIVSGTTSQLIQTSSGQQILVKQPQQQQQQQQQPQQLTSTANLVATTSHVLPVMTSAQPVMMAATAPPPQILATTTASPTSNGKTIIILPYSNSGQSLPAATTATVVNNVIQSTQLNGLNGNQQQQQPLVAVATTATTTAAVNNPPVLQQQQIVNGPTISSSSNVSVTNVVSPSTSTLPSCTTLTTTSAVPTVPSPKPDPACPFLCEWTGCMKAFKTPKEVENHAIKTHCPLGSDDIPCLWSRCDGMRRKRFSLMTHLQDRHCHPQLMKLMAVRRVQMAQSGKSDVPLPPAPPAHPGYAPNAALHAIKRHALEFVSPKEMAMRDEKEGPVTKSIRLTSSLILKNLVIYSSLGKSKLRAYESHLSTVALSNVESSRTVSQILYDMADYDSKQK